VFSELGKTLLDKSKDQEELIQELENQVLQNIFDGDHS
jgi:hypothetical protein